MASNNGSNRYVLMTVAAVISGLISALLVFLAVWFTAVQGVGDSYAQDRSFIMDSLARQERALNSLHTDRFDTAVRLAEVRVELLEIKRILDRMERERRVD